MKKFVNVCIYVCREMITLTYLRTGIKDISRMQTKKHCQIHSEEEKEKKAPPSHTQARLSNKPCWKTLNSMQFIVYQGKRNKDVEEKQYYEFLFILLMSKAITIRFYDF